LIVPSFVAQQCIARIAPPLEVLCSIVASLACGIACGADDWPEHGHDKGGTRFSSLRQITPQNVDDLELAWTYSSGEIARRGSAYEQSSEQSIPILVAGRLVICTPFHRIVALDPATGVERWVFDPEVDTDVGPKAEFKCRGVAQWTDTSAPPDAACSTRLVFATTDLRLFAIDAVDGRRCKGFGVAGEVALDPERPLAFKGELSRFSAPAIVNGTIVLGSHIVDDYRASTPHGTVQAFDARTGARRWTFDPIPRDADDPAYSTWRGGSAATAGSANVWAHMAVDEQRDLVFLPTSTPAPDSWGGLRPGDNRYANSIVALRGATGEVVWHFQLVHHSIWDYDVAAQPLLVDLPRDGAVVPALVQNTKQGLVFVFNRATGEPLFPIEERAVPTGDVPGEWYSPTQPFPVRPPPLVPQGSSPDDAWGFTWWDRRACRRMIEALRHGPIYTPPSEQGTIVSPWPAGGVNWGGAAYEPERRWMIVNTNRLMKVVRLRPATDARPEANAAAAGDGTGDFEYDPPVRLIGTPYLYEEGLLLSPLGAPCNKPPWGALTAVDLVAGTIAWEVPLGSIEQFLPLPIPWRLGTPNIGGPIVTAGGLVFIGATMDSKLRAFAVADGRELWHADLPAPAMTSPMTYEAAGRQFVVIVAGGAHELPGPRSDRTVAFALPATGDLQ
jgi:quinoprotein glucose dehydrogenase